MGVNVELLAHRLIGSSDLTRAQFHLVVMTSFLTQPLIKSLEISIIVLTIPTTVYLTIVVCLCFRSGTEDSPVQPTEGRFGAADSAHQSSSPGQMSTCQL